MTISALELDTVTNASAACKIILGDMLPRLQGLQHIYDSGGGVKETLTQDELNEVTALSGLTKTQVDDAMYVLTAVLLPAIDSNYAQLAQLAARHRGTMPMPPTTML
jgi:hypothetical protein